MNSPDPPSTCEQCGAPLEQNVFQQGCLNCLLMEGLRHPDSSAGDEERFYQHYEILRHEDGSLWELGRGAMGVTYKAQDTTLHVPVALKVINALFSSQSAVRTRFLMEARAAARLIHPNVASVYHYGTIGTAAGESTPPANDGDCFYAMEFIQGETLEERLRRDGALSPDLVMEIGTQITRALVAAEKKGLVHCDLKPSNIMLADDGEHHLEHGGAWVKVIDFGVARAVGEAVESAEPDWLDSQPARSCFRGTPSFASPEQLASAPLDTRSDIYSLGVTLWLCLTGKYPFKAPHRSRVEIPRTGLPDASAVPPALRDLLAAMLSFDKAGRPSSAMDLLEKLAASAAAAGRIPAVKAQTHPILTDNREAFQYFRSAQDAVNAIAPTRERLEEAIRLLDRSIAHDPRFAGAHAMLAEIHALMYRHSHDRTPARARTVLDAVEIARRLNPESGEGHRASGIYHYHIKNDYRAARRDFTEALRLLPSDADSLMGLGLVASRGNRWEEAVDCFRKAAELSPYRTEYANQWWRTLEAMRRYSEARQVLVQMIGRHPENLRIRLSLTYLNYLETGDLQPLQEFLDAVPADYDPDGAITFQRWGLARYKNDPDAAERILAASPLASFAGHVDGQLYPRATLELLNVLLRDDREKAGRMASAQLPFLQGMVAQMPDTPGALMLLAICQATSLEPGNCAELGLRALAMLPPEADGIDGPKLVVQMIWVYIRMEQYGQALDLLEKYATWPGCMSYGELLWGVTYRELRSFPRCLEVLRELARSATAAR